MMVKIAVCDDDAEYLKSKKHCFAAALKNAGLNFDLRFFINGNRIIQSFQSHEPYDIVILDIDMPDINGKTVAEKLRVLNSSFFLIFITSYKSEVYNTIPYRINAFISKDCTDDYIVSELTRVFEEYRNYKPEYEMLSVYSVGKKQSIRISLNDVFYFYCVKKTNYVVTGTNEYRLSIERFSEIEKYYLKKGFFEICRGYIVNISKVKAVQNSAVILDNEVSLPLSRGRKAMLLDKISEYVSGEADSFDMADT